MFFSSECSYFEFFVDLFIFPSRTVNTRRSINQYFFFCVKVYLIIIFIYSISISISSLTSSFIHSTPLQLIKNIHEGFFLSPQKHGTLYNDPGYIGYWRPPAMNKIYYPEMETQSAETKGEKSVGSKQLDSLNSGRVEDAVLQTSTHKVAEKSTSTAAPKHKTEAQHISVTAAPEHQAQEQHSSISTKAPQHQTDLSRIVEDTQNKDKMSGKAKDMSPKSKITSVKLTIQDEGSSSKWNDQMTEVIKEVYGGELPYSENNIVLDDESGKNADKANKEEELAPSRVNQSPDLNEQIPEKSTQKSTTLKIKDNLETNTEEDSMQKVIRKIQETKVEQAATKPKQEPTPMPTLTHQKQEVKVSSTTAAPSTRPNPPTTRPTRVTPVSERKTEPKLVPSKPHGNCFILVVLYTL